MEYVPVTRSRHPTAEPVAVNQQPSLLVVKTANQTIRDAMSQPIPHRLCGNLWFEGEVGILFADTNLGKSIASVQLADNITKGKREGPLGSDSPAQAVVYLDFELSDKQFEKRYSIDYERHYRWDDSFLRVKINPTFTDFEDFETQLFAEIESVLASTGARVLIVDNITYLKMQSTESGKEAMSLMKHLTHLKHKFDLSLLVLAHTPKRPHLSSPLSFNDLAGSKQLSNFADSIFCIGKSHQDSDVRYIKQLKARSCSVEEEVYLFRLEKSHNFLGFNFEGTDFEWNHLKPKSDGSDELTETVLSLRTEHPDWSLQQIAEATGTNKMKVKRTLDKNPP